MKSTHEISIEMAADVVRLTQDMQRAQSIVDRGMQGMARSADIAVKALGALGVTLSLGAIVGIVRDLGRVSNEITNMSRAAGLGVEQFQVLAFGAERFGVSQEKLADIVKDTQDKIGDFVQTGGGAMADFFENIAPRVGVTVDQFRALNGADALQLYVSSLEKANLSQADMVFYMEAIASDSTLLLPLLQDGGKALQEYGDSAMRMGKILDEEAVAAARNFDNAMKDVSDSVDGVRSQMVVGLAPAMSEVALEIAGLIQDVPELIDRLSPFLAGGAIVGGFLALNAAMNLVAATATTKLLPALVAFGPAVGTILAAAAAIGYIDSASKKAQEPIERLNRLLQTQSELQKKVDENGADARGSNFGVPEIETYGERLRIVNANIANTRKEIEGVADSKAWDDLQSELTLMAAGWDNVGDSFSKGKKSAAELSAENKRNAEIAKAVTSQLNLLAKAQEDANAARAATLKTEIESTVKIQEQVAELRDQTVAYGQNEKGLRRLELAKIDDQIATIEMRIAMAEFGAANRELIPVYQAQVQALRDLKAAKMGLFDAQAQEENKKAMEQLTIQAAQEFDRIFDDMSRALTDALFAGGKSGGELLKNYFKTFAIKVFVEPEIKAALSGLLGVGSGSGGIAASLLGNVGSSFFQNSLLGGLSGAFGSAAGYAAAVPGLTSAAAGSQAALLAAQTGSFGVAGTAATAAAGGSAAAGFASSALTAAPYIAAAAFIVGALRSKKISASNLGPEFQSDLTSSIETAFTSVLTGLGGTSDATFVGAGNTGRQGQNPNFNIRAFGGGREVFYSGQTAEGQADGLFLNGEIALNEANVADQTTRAIVAALKLSDFADNIDAVIQSLDPFNSSLDELNAGLQNAQLLAGVNNLTETTGVLATLSGASLETVQSLLALTGGIEGLAQGQAAFYQAFTSEQQKAADLTATVTSAFAQFGKEVPTTRDGLRDLVDGLNLQDAEQQKLYATILQLTPALDQLLPGFEQVTEAAEEQVIAVESISEAYGRLTQVQMTAEQIAQQRISLEQELFNLTATSEQQLKAQRAALDESNRALFDQIQAVKAEQAAEVEAQQAIAAAQQRAAAIANERLGLEGRLLQLQGDTEALRYRELEALDDSNRSLLKQIFELEDATRAEQERAAVIAQATADQERAAQELAALQERIASERLGLENQLLQLQGNTVELRNRERAALDESNQALFDQIIALQDSQAAAQEAAAAQQELAAVQQAIVQERESLESRLLQLQGDTAALRERELMALDASNRGLLEQIFALQDAQEAAQAAAQAEQQRIDEVRQAAEDALQIERDLQAARDAIASERLSLENQLLQLQGNTVEILRREREALDESNRGLFDQIQALREQQAAAQAAQIANEELARIQEEAAATVRAIADERFNLESRLLQAQGDTNALRLRELAAIDESNRSILEQIFALEDAAVASQAAAQAEQDRIAQAQQAADELLRIEQELAQAQQAIAQERFGLESRLLQLQGKTSELRARDLAALDASNRALLEQIFALEDAQAAAQLAAQAEQERVQAAQQAADELVRIEQELAAKQQAIASERFGLETRLLQLQGNTTALREREILALDASNQALLRQIFALEDAQAKAAKLEQAQAERLNQIQQAQDEATRAAEQYASALRSVTDTVFAEIDRLRGRDSGGSLSSLQTQFAILTAQARAGNLDALGKLPEFSRAIEQASTANATSLVDVQRIRAQLANSLEQTVGGSFASGGSVASIAPGPIVQQQTTPTSAGNSDLVAEVRALRQQVSTLITTAQQTTVNTGKSARTLDDVTQGGTTLRTTTV